MTLLVWAGVAGVIAIVFDLSRSALIRSVDAKRDDLARGANLVGRVQRDGDALGR